MRRGQGLAMASSPMPIYLFAGDSLTEGVYGESYVECVAQVLERGRSSLGGKVVNAGRGCDTVKSLLARIEEPLDQVRPQWVILAVGGNDVWLPWLASHSLVWWLWLLYRRIRLGQKPTTDLDRFASAYRALIDRSRQFDARVLACTTTPVGERLSSPVNRQLARLNGVIKHVAVDCQVPVADVWQAFVQELAVLSRPSRYVPGEWLFHWQDRQRLRTTSPDEIARRRRLHLTFDGIHLNSRGAELWAQTILSALARIQETALVQPSAAVRSLDVSCFEQEALQVCVTPGWEARARDLGYLLGGVYEHLASVTGARPAICLAVLSEVHWSQAAGAHIYPGPVALWDGEMGTLLLPEAYTEQYLRSVHLPETVGLWTSWPPSVAELGEPARATALADLLAIQELARLFLRELKVAPADPALQDLLTAYLAQVALHGREGEGTARMAALWNAWGEVLARAGVEEGRRRLEARALFQKHGEDLVASFAGARRSIKEQINSFGL
jgi:lysophospholipase L1-like esterase